MIQNLLDLQPNKVSVNLSQYSMVWIGNSGDGKTHTLKLFLESLVDDGKKPLFLMFEDRYQNIPGIMAVKVNNVAEFKGIVNQLKNPKLKEKYSCIVVDTIDKFEETGEQYVTDGHEVAILDDVGGYGKGTRYYKKVLRGIGDLRNLGYTVHFVAQSTTQFKDNKIEKIDMKLSKNALSYIKEGAFLVGYLWKEDTNEGTERYITFKKSDLLPNLKDTFGLPEKINVRDLKQTLEDTISSLGEGNVTQDTTIIQYVEETDFNTLKERGNELGGLLAENGYLEEATAVLTKNIGTNEDGSPKMFSNLKEGQIDLAKVVVMELEELVNKYKLA